ncbi:acetylxylan esterase [Hymenobacter psoromatis]|nr:acetylxylan esterase [Hymenobacter psoromatis]
MLPTPPYLRNVTRAALCGLGLLCATGPGRAQTPSQPDPAAEKARRLALATADWQLMLNKLHLTLPTLPPPATDPARPAGTGQRPGFSSWFDAAGNRYIRSSWGRWTNYDQATAGTAARPDPLVLRNGRPVRDARTWYQQRRPEILADITTEVYGRIPANTPVVRFAITATDAQFLGGKVVRQTIEGQIDNARYPAAAPRIRLVLYTPAAATGPVPLVVVVGDLPTAPAGQPDVLSQVLAAGWALATFDPAAVQMDSGAGLNAGIIGLMGGGRPRQPADWGTLAAWSWGLSRVLDYVATDKRLDARYVALQGHSRWGKTTLLAAALDTRWALAYVSCSGAMGASLEKRDFGETIDNVAEPSEYHWMAGNFLKYAGHWDAMPTDAHELLALVAPRPVFITGGTTDSWTDARGTFLAGVGASPVYALLGKKSLPTAEMPAPDVALLNGDLAFREHTGGHTDLPDWPAFIEFARKYFPALAQVK